MRSKRLQVCLVWFWSLWVLCACQNLAVQPHTPLLSFTPEHLLSYFNEHPQSSYYLENDPNRSEYNNLKLLVSDQLFSKHWLFGTLEGELIRFDSLTAKWDGKSESSVEYFISVWARRSDEPEPKAVSVVLAISLDNQRLDFDYGYPSPDLKAPVERPLGQGGS